VRSDISKQAPDREILSHESRMHTDTGNSWKYVPRICITHNKNHTTIHTVLMAIFYINLV